jgi:hypothetical protein
MATASSKGGKGKTVEPHAQDDACECRSGPLAGSARINGATFSNKWLNYADVDGDAVFEGDIVLGRTAELQAEAPSLDMQPQFSIGITGAQFRWPGGLIPYEIDSALPNQQRVTDALAHWVANTAIRFVARNPGNAAHANYVRFQPGNGCSSMVGMRGGRQNITLGSGCTLGNTIHEIGHAVGLWHEQSREDRDNFITIVWANIDPAMQHNFSQHIADGDDLGAYDFGSIMHYPATAFSVNGQATIMPRQALPPGVSMGQRSGLSAGDIAGVRVMYPNIGSTSKEVRKDPIQDPVTIKEVRKDPTADPTVKEVRKDPVQDPVTIKEVRKDPTADPTFKEVRKDPVRDPVTIKEVGRDPGPIGPVRPPRPGFDFGATPYVLAGASRYEPQDPVAQAAEQVQQLAEAHTQAQEQADALAEAYEQSVQVLEALQQGGGA